MSFNSAGNVWDSNKPDGDDFLIDDSDEEVGYIQPDHAIEADVPSSDPSSSAANAAAAAGASRGSQQAPPPAYSLDQQFTNATGGRVETRRFMGGDTLDEPVSATLMRDVRSVAFRLRQVIWYTPASSLQQSHPGVVPQALSSLDFPEHRVDQEWDMWGPLVFCLLISLTMSLIAPNHQSSVVFSGVFVLIWAGQAVVSLNIKLLGGTISVFHALCVTGYCLFPLVLSALMSSIVRLILVRIIFDAFMVIWAIYAATKGLQDSGVEPGRVILATFPVGLFYTGLGWLCVIT